MSKNVYLGWLGTRISNFSFNPIWHGLWANLFDMGGGAIWPPLQKKPGTCRLVVWFGEVVRLGPNFMRIPNLSPPRSLWRHSDVIMVMTSPKSVIVGNRHNYCPHYSLIVINPSFFMFWNALLNKMYINDYYSQNVLRSAVFPSRFLMTSLWRHVISSRRMLDFFALNHFSYWYLTSLQVSSQLDKFWL